jgi:DNA repair protein RadD
LRRSAPQWRATEVRERWPNQIKARDELPGLLVPKSRVCAVSPTGTGKGVIMQDQMDVFEQVVLYTHRRMLLRQLSKALHAAGKPHGVIAAGQSPDLNLPIQLASIQTVVSRSIKNKKMPLHRARLAIFDEAHLHTEASAEAIMDAHREQGAAILGITATPLDLGHMYDRLFIAGDMTMGRACGAIVPGIVYAPDEPDCKDLKRTQTGEYREGDAIKKIMSATIIGRVIENYHAIMQQHGYRPTVLFGPGVKESLWFAEELTREGIPSAHIDGERVWIDGETLPSSDASRKRVEDAMRAGEIHVVCNRFVMREGIDWTFLKHAIMATIFGSLGSYIQACGRPARAFGDARYYTVQDHGGNYHRHGSPNADRDWSLGDTAYIVGEMREDRLREKEEPEPIVCPKCKAVRATGSHCPMCKHITDAHARIVVQKDGTLREVRGEIYERRRVDTRPTAEREWIECYWRAKKSSNEMTFNQARGLFASEHNGAYPPAGLPFMPRERIDWYMRVKDVPYSRLVPNPDFKPKAEPVVAGLFGGAA